MYTINNLITSLLTVGGLGSLNYITLVSMGVMDKKDKTDSIALSIIFSLVDYCIYLGVQAGLKTFSFGNNTLTLVISTIITLILSLLVTLLTGGLLLKMYYKAVNTTRNISHKGKIAKETPFEEIASGDIPAFCYLYDFEHHKLGYGYLTNSSINNPDNFQMNLIPSDNGGEQPEYSRLIRNIHDKQFKKEYHVTQHINFKQKFIVICLENQA